MKFSDLFKVTSWIVGVRVEMRFKVSPKSRLLTPHCTVRTGLRNLAPKPVIFKLV